MSRCPALYALAAMLSLAAAALTAAAETDAPTEAQQEQGPDAVAALMEASRPSFLVVSFYSRELPAEQRDREDPFSGELLAEYARREYPLETTGVVFNEQGWVLTVDRLLDLRMVERIEGRTIGGEPFELEVLGVLPRTPLLVLRPKDVEAAALPALQFAPAPEMTVETQLCGVNLEIDDDELIFGGSTASKPVEIRRPSGTEALIFRGIGVAGGVAVAGDAEGRPIGVVPPGFHPESRQEDFLWLAEDLAQMPLYPIEQIAEDRQRLAEDFAESTFKVAVTFRTDGQDRYADAEDRERTLFGFAVDPAHLLVPVMLDRKTAEKIEKIEIEMGEAKQPAVLVGALKSARAMILKLEAGAFADPIALAGNTALPWIVPVMHADVGQRYGKADVRVYLDRCVGRLRSFGGVFRYKTYRQLRREAPTVLLDDDGRVIAMSLKQRPPFETIRQIRRYGATGRDGDEADFVTFTGAELAEMITTDPDRLDRRIRSLARDDRHRRPWLGVEVSAMSEELAETLDIQKPTRDGTLGLVVGVVYPHSPAERIGLKPSDVLLKITPVGKPELDIELQARYADFRGGRDYYSDLEFSEIRAGGFVQPVWKERYNFLTALLDEIGVGERIELTWLEDGEQRSEPMTIEQAPRDVQSAAKATDEPTGLTVKELTYEVRVGYKLAEDAPGVLVFRAKSGSKAALARLEVFSIISRVDEQPVTGPEQFIDLLNAAREAGQPSVKLFVKTPGSERIADLPLE